MRYLSLISFSLAAACLSPAAQAQNCEGGAYMNPQLFRGEAAYQSAVAEQEMHAFIGRAGLPQAPLYAIKKVDDITASGRTPYCWVYTNQVTGLMSGYKLAVFNLSLIHI